MKKIPKPLVLPTLTLKLLALGARVYAVFLVFTYTPWWVGVLLFFAVDSIYRLAILAAVRIWVATLAVTSTFLTNED